MLSEHWQRGVEVASKAADRAREPIDKVKSSVHVPRSHVPDYLSLLTAANEQFARACRTVAERHGEETEVRSTLTLLERYSHEPIEELRPFVEKYGRREKDEPGLLPKRH